MFGVLVETRQRNMEIKPGESATVIKYAVKPKFLIATQRKEKEINKLR